MGNRASDRIASTPVAITPGTDISKGCSSAVISCTVAGTLTLKLAGGNMLLNLLAGVTVIPDVEVLGVTAGTATATVYALR